MIAPENFNRLKTTVSAVIFSFLPLSASGLDPFDGESLPPAPTPNPITSVNKLAINERIVGPDENGFFYIPGNSKPAGIPNGSSVEILYPSPDGKACFFFIEVTDDPPVDSKGRVFDTTRTRLEAYGVTINGRGELQYTNIKFSDMPSRTGRAPDDLNSWTADAGSISSTLGYAILNKTEIPKGADPLVEYSEQHFRGRTLRVFDISTGKPYLFPDGTDAFDLKHDHQIIPYYYGNTLFLSLPEKVDEKLVTNFYDFKNPTAIAFSIPGHLTAYDWDKEGNVLLAKDAGENTNYFVLNIKSKSLSPATKEDRSKFSEPIDTQAPLKILRKGDSATNSAIEPLVIAVPSFDSKDEGIDKPTSVAGVQIHLKLTIGPVLSITSSSRLDLDGPQATATLLFRDGTKNHPEDFRLFSLEIDAGGNLRERRIVQRNSPEIAAILKYVAPEAALRAHLDKIESVIYKFKKDLDFYEHIDNEKFQEIMADNKIIKMYFPGGVGEMMNFSYEDKVYKVNFIGEKDIVLKIEIPEYNLYGTLEREGSQLFVIHTNLNPQEKSK